MNREEFEELLREQESERARCKDRILNSDAPRKVIVSGPGTGKTHTFKELLSSKDGNCLALTFINNLANKLKKDLKGYAKACTFHKFCKELLHVIPKTDLTDKFELFPKLETIIESDARILIDDSPKFMIGFRKIDLSNRNIDFFLKRSSYYDAVSFDDSVYRVMDYFQYHPDQIPVYTQIVVDEYQDFNKLEVEFLNILSEKSPILIVGDDDQALYGMLKNASVEYIRNRYNDPSYVRFDLPYCGRCTLVVTQALEDIISKAKRINKLKSRIEKEYICYLPDKWEDSKKYPKIVHANCSTQSNKAPYLARFVAHEIAKLTPEEVRTANEKGDFTVLVAGSGHYLEQVQNHFKELGKYKLFFRKEEDYRESIKIIDGYITLLNKGELSNLGWRILLEFDHLQNTEEIIKKTEENPALKLYEILPPDYVKEHSYLVNLLSRLKEGEELNNSDTQRLEGTLGLKVDKMREVLAMEVEKEQVDTEENKEEISIVFSTYVGCKGLSAGFVFIIGLDEKSLPRNNASPSDIEICNFIVSLVRTIKKCYLVSTRFFINKKTKPSVFIRWINPKRLDYMWVDKTYFGTN